MRFEWFVGRRYLRAKHKQGFISLITVISLAGVALGVLALIVVLAVYTGFTDGLRDQIIGINSHVIVQEYDGVMDDPALVQRELEQLPDVVASMPYIYAQGLISGARGSSGIVLRGIDPEGAARVLGLDGKIVVGSLDNLLPRDDTGENRLPGILVGQEMARQLGLALGDRVRLMAPEGPLSPMGVLPRVRACVVAGIFSTGMYEYDATMGFLALETARRLVNLEAGSHGLEVRVRQLEQADRTAAAIRTHLGPGFTARDWMAMNQNLFAALKLEKVGLFIALDLIILVAALNIISALVMVVMEKTRDIAILKTMGAGTGAILRIFIMQGAVIALGGTSLGVVGGLGLCQFLSRTKLIELPRNVYPMSTLPIKIVPLDVTIIAVSAIVITLVATLYPSWKAARVRPAEALRHE
ncbi:MAG: ABC transporter permease [Desulfobulbaceae bacterium A2]|nr:MAG: ABC transporter permease [Desulfobulbaceae bacterium A2]